MRFSIGTEYYHQGSPVVYMGDVAGILTFLEVGSGSAIGLLPAEAASNITSEAPALLVDATLEAPVTPVKKGKV